MSRSAQFEDQSLDGEVFRNCSMKGTLFEDIDLSDASYSNVNLQRVRLENVNLAGALIDGANIEGLTVAGHNVQELIRNYETVSAAARSAEDTLPGAADRAASNRTAAPRAFLPTRDFDTSKAFYEKIGFEKLLDSDVAIFKIGTEAFILQRRFQKEWAENCMMQLMVDDLDSWWSDVEALDLPALFAIPAPKPPAMQPWGLRLAYLIDPAGVLWHIAERREGMRCD